MLSDHCQPGLANRSGELISVYVWRWEGAKKAVPSGHSLEHGRVPLNLGRHRVCGDRALAWAVQRGCGVSILGNIQKPRGRGAG